MKSIRRRIKGFFSILTLIIGFVLSVTTTGHAGAFTFTQIDFPGASSTIAIGINNSGQIVGGFNDSNHEHVFLYSGGTFTQIDFPRAILTIAYGINNSGQIVGDFNDNNKALD